MSDGKDISFIGEALGPALRTDLNALNGMLQGLLEDVNGVRNQTAREPLIAAMGELDGDLQEFSAKVKGMEARIELAKNCLMF